MTSQAQKQITDLAAKIKESRPGEPAIKTALSTSDRVLRRVTDGIYREPWSALRELISNAYDADAAEVSIDMDAPRFSEIRIRDDGAGFTAEALASMIKSIGGSPKRTPTGAELGVTKLSDPDRSPQGRKLIGKLGIGLFAVSQLTHEFQIITKRADEPTRTVADVLLYQYAEGPTAKSTETAEEFRTGSVRIWKMPAKQKRSHGTEIILRNLLPRTKAELSSADHWKALLKPQNEDGNGTVSYPMYHIGCIQPDDPGEFLVPPELPWGQETDPDKRFRLFTARMFERADEAGLRRPSLDNTFDNYFKFLWFLSLSAPLDYLDKHPFDLDGSSGIRVFQLSNSKEGRATELSLKQGLTVREALGLKSPERGTNLEFRVLVDGVSLKRPIRFADLPKSRHSVDRPLLFVGQDRPDLSKHPETIRGGDLEFEGYLLWCPRVIPVEHNGVLVRVNDASGTLFDKTFMKYQVSELLRLQQVSSELFVTEGLDAALNIDRESFNIAHPHYQYIASWVHNAFKQFATRHKDLAQGARTTRRATEAAQSQQVLVREVSSIVDRLTRGDEDPMTVEFAEPLPASAPGKRADVVTYSLDKVFERYAPGSRATPKKALEFEHDQAVMRGVAQVLYASGVFDRMGHEQQEQLLADLAAVIFVGRGA